MPFELDNLVRENIRRLVPYSSARSEFSGDARIFMDANENSFGSPTCQDHSRYPDPFQKEIKSCVAELNGISPSQVFVGNGSDEAIDLLFRIFCRPSVDNVIICPPTYGMYEVLASINDVALEKVFLTRDFDLDVPAILAAIDQNTKIIFLCSPNNPTGNLVSRNAILEIAGTFEGIVVVDEAYVHFSTQPSLTKEIGSNPNLVVLQTFSKAWGLAGLRVGLAFGDAKIIELFDRVKPPYNLSDSAQSEVLSAFINEHHVVKSIREIRKEREILAEKIKKFEFVTTVYPSDANFMLVKTIDADAVYLSLLDNGIVVRNRSRVPLCEGCVRITVGTPDENTALLNALEQYEKSSVH